jgi:hypothetical protein
VRRWGFMAHRATCGYRMGTVVRSFADTAARVLRTAQDDAGRTELGQDEVYAALSVYVRYGWGRFAPGCRLAFTRALVAVARTEAVQRHAEAHRRSALTGVPAVLEQVAALRCYPRKLMAVAMAAFYTLRRSYNLIARRAALVGASALHGWRVAA